MVTATADTRRTSGEMLLYASGGTVMLAALFYLSQRNFLLFHGLAELFAVAVAWSVFLLVFNTRRIASNPALALLGTAYLFVGLTDLLHTFAYNGMGVFPGGNTTNLATQLWVAARVIEALGLLAFALLLDRRFRLRHAAAGFAGLTALLFATIFWWDVFPTCFVEGMGLTHFKKGTEYAICLVLAGTVLLLRRKRGQVAPDVLRLMTGAIALTIAAELTFTLYVDVYGFTIVAGHLLKLISFFLVYLALVRSSVINPYATLFRKLGTEQHALRESEGNLRSLFNAISESVCLLDRNGTVLAGNETFAARLGRSLADCTGVSIRSLVPPHVANRRQAATENVLKTGKPAIIEDEHEGRWYLTHIWPVKDADGTVTRLVMYAADITERKQAEQALLESEQRFAKLFERAPLGYQSLDEDGHFLEANEAWLDILGYNRDEVIGKWFGDFLAPEYVDAFRERFPIFKANGRIHSEFEMLHKNGTRRFIAFDGRIGYKKDGTFEKTHCILQDVTDRVRMEKALRESEERYRLLVETANEGVWSMDADHATTYVNSAMAAMLGYEPGEMIGRKVEEFFYPEDMAFHAERMKLRHAGQDEVYERRFRRRDGSDLWTLVSAKATRDDRGAFSGSFAMFTDITERKRADEELRLKSLVLDQIQDHVTVTDLEGNITYVNQANERTLGKPAHELVGKSVHSLGDDTARGATQADIIETTRREGGWRGEVVNYAADGTEHIMDCRTRVVHDASGTPVALCGIATDITERKRVEEALRQNEQTLQSLFNAITESVCLFEEGGSILAANRTFAERIGRNVGECIGRDIYTLIPPDVAASRRERVVEMMRTGTPLFFEDEREGRWLRHHLWPVPGGNGSPAQIVIYATDITDLKHAGEELVAKTRTLESIYDSTPVVIMLVDAEGRVASINRTAESFTGRGRDELVGLLGGEVFRCLNALEGRGCGLNEECSSCPVRTRVEHTLTTGEPVHDGEGSLMLDRDGTPARFDFTVSTSLMETDRTRQVLVTLSDITARKQAEVALKESEGLFRSLVESMLDPMVILRFDGTVVFSNPAAVRMFGLPDTTLVEGMSFAPFLDEAFLPLAMADLERIRLDGGPHVSEYQVRTLEGDPRWVEAQGGRIMYRGEPADLVTLRDTTERKQAEEMLRYQAGLITSLLDSSPDLIFFKDLDGVYLGCNAEFARHVGKAKDEVAGKTDHDLYPREEADGYRANDLLMLESGATRRNEEWVSYPDGRKVLVDTLKTPLRDAEGNLTGILGISRDITESKRMTIMLDAVRRAQSMYILHGDLRNVFDSLLKTLVEMTGSEFGFLDEVLRDPDGTPYKLSLALPDISWSLETHALYEELRARRLEFRNLDNLAGLPALTGEPLIANDALNDPHAGGLTHGHPPVRTFMGLPMYFGDQLVGVAGVANRPGGYDEDLARFLEPFLSACAGIIHSVRLQGLESEAVAALRTSEERFRLFTDLAPVGIIISDMADNVLYLSPKFVEMYGYTPEDIPSAEAWWPLAYPDAELRKHVKALWAGAVVGAVRTHSDAPPMEFPVTCKDGTVRQTEFRLASTGDMNVSVLVDISDRKQAETAIRESEERFRMIAENTSDGIFVYEKGAIKYVSPAYVRILGYPASEEIGRTEESIRTLIHPDDVDGVFKLVWESITSHQETHDIAYTYRARAKDDRWVWREDHARLMYDADGNYTSSVVVCRDITNRKEAEEALRKSHALLENLARLVPGVIYQYRLWPDGHSAFPYASPGMIDIYEVTPEEVREDAAPVFDKLHPDDRERVTREIMASAASLGDFYTEYRVVLPRQGLRWRMCQALPQRLEDGSILWHGIITDITDRREAEEEQEQLRAQLTQAQKMESVGRLAGGVAHDFNNMLNVIMGHAEIVLETLDPANPMHGDIIEIRRAAERSADLTRQLLAFARKQTASPRVLDLNETIGGMLKMLGRLIGEDIDLAWVPGDNLWAVKIDPSQMDQILANLCVNARDAIDGVGRITIETRNVSLDEDEVTGWPGADPGDHVALVVTDTGSGMNSETLEHLFEPFFTTKAMGRGTGLGLATVYGVVRQNHGAIHVESTPGQGTTFTICLPRHAGKAAEWRDGSIERPVPRGKETILLVEDEPVILRMTARILDNMGYTVLTAALPGEAIRIAETHPEKIDLLMTDVVMPEMNGRDLAKNIQSLYPEIKRLFMSGYTADVIAHQGVLDPGVHFIQKPFTMKDLAEVLRETLGEA